MFLHNIDENIVFYQFFPVFSYEKHPKTQCLISFSSLSLWKSSNNTVFNQFFQFFQGIPIYGGLAVAP